MKRGLVFCEEFYNWFSLKGWTNTIILWTRRWRGQVTLRINLPLKKKKPLCRVWMTRFGHLNLNLGDWYPNNLFKKFKKDKKFGFDKSARDSKSLKYLDLKSLIKSMDSKSLDFKSINLKSKSKSSKFSNTTVVTNNYMNFGTNMKWTCGLSCPKLSL